MAFSKPLVEVFPRLYALKDLVPDPTHPNAYFQHFEERLKENEHNRRRYLEIELPLQALDPQSWHDMSERAAPLAIERHRTRGWQPLFDTLNEAKGFAYLKSLGCSGIGFKPRDRTKTPDLRAALNGRPVICEVKTINISDEEADHRTRVFHGEIIPVSVPISVTTKMLDKITKTLEEAIKQLDCEDPTQAARRFVFTVLHFDDWVGDYQTEYIAQIDAHLAANPVQGAELVFCPASNLFERIFVMRSATIVDM